MALIQCKECGKEMSSGAKACPHCGYKRAEYGCGTLIVLLVLVVIMVSIFSGGKSDHPPPTTAAPADQEPAASKVKLDKLSWKKGGFDNVMLINARLTNSGDRPVKDVTITCELSAPSETKVDKNIRIVYQTVLPKKSIQLREFSMGFIHSQSEKANCEVTAAVYQ